MKFNKKEWLEKRVYLIIASLFFIYFSFSLISASSSYRELPGICLQHNITNYEIWLEDYFDIDEDENITIRFIDPVNDNIINLPNGYSSLNLECFEVANIFQVREDVFTDLVILETYDEDCNATIYVRFDSDELLNQYFNLEVLSSCDEYQPPPDISYTQQGSYTYTQCDEGSTGAVSGYGPNDAGVYNYLNFTNFGIEAITMNLYREYNGTYTGQFYMAIRNEDGTLLTRVNVPYSEINNLDFVNITKQLPESYVLDGNYYIGFEIEKNGDGQSDIDFQKCNGKSPIWDIHTTLNGVLGTFEDNIVFNESVMYIYFHEIGNGTQPTSSYIDSIYMNLSQDILLDLDSYFGSWEDMYVTSPDPWNDYQYMLYTGYSTINSDYYELQLFNNGTLNISSYERPYDYEINAFACNYTPYEVCVNRTFHVYIEGTIGNVTQINPMQNYYNLGFWDSYLFSGNYFFQYYDTITLAIPDSNWTGVLDDTMPFEYIELEEPVNNVSYMVYFNCTISDDTWNYTYLGDLNITFECGSQQSYYRMTAYNNYNQKVYLTACNQFGCLSDYTTILSGNPSLPTGYVPALEEVSSNTSYINNTLHSFQEAFPTVDELNRTGRLRLMYVVIFTIIGVTFLGLFKISLKLAVYVCIIELMLLLFFFADMRYTNPFYPVMLLVGFVGFHAIKFIRGGG